MSTAEIGATTEPIADPDMLYEIVDGQLVEKTMGAYEGGIASLLLEMLGPYVRLNGIGRAYNEILFRTSPDRKKGRRPDLVFLSSRLWPIDRPLPRAEVVDFFPDLAVEVVSPTDLAVQEREKVEEYFAAGARQVWEIYPTLGTILVHDSPTNIRAYRRGDVLDGGDLLPGFRLAVSDLLVEPADD